jgi:hypothetical protein
VFDQVRTIDRFVAHVLLDPVIRHRREVTSALIILVERNHKSFITSGKDVVHFGFTDKPCRMCFDNP